MKSETALVRSRKAARESAFKAVYAMLVGHCDLEAALSPDTLGHEFTPDVADWVRKLVSGAANDVATWDDKFRPHLAGGWTLERLAVTDKVILRMACFEFYECADTPPKSTISEYVELAKRYGTAESGRFVNGVLAAVLAQSPKKDWEPAQAVTVAPSAKDKAAMAPKSVKEKPKAKAKWVVKSDG